MTRTTDPDALTTLLLCSGLAAAGREGDGPKPLSAAQWHTLLGKLRGAGLSAPSDLLGREAGELERTTGIKPESAERIVRLLDRAGQMAIELERLADHGVWALTERDDAYPSRLADRLQERAPPVLFGAGSRALLAAGGLAIVGSRDIDEDGESFARALGADCAGRGVAVISGGARGTDRFGMIGALDAGGCALGVLAESLLQTLRDAETGRLIRDEQLTLATAFNPAAGFTVGNAMGRNKLLYCLADAAVVVSSADGSGGTWSGAIENLDHRWTPLFVRSVTNVPAGNRALIAHGGVPLASPETPAAVALEETGDDQSRQPGRHEHHGRDPQTHEVESTERAATETDAARAMPGTVGYAVDDLFHLVWPMLDRYLDEPRTPQQVAERFRLEQQQAKAWLTRAAEEKRATVQSKRPLRYGRCAPRLL